MLVEMKNNILLALKGNIVKIHLDFYLFNHKPSAFNEIIRSIGDSKVTFLFMQNLVTTGRNNDAKVVKLLEVLDTSFMYLAKNSM